MVGIYFSGTGNTKYCIEQFVNEIDYSAPCISIEDANAVTEIQKNDKIILAYPIYYSNIPKIMRDFIMKNRTAFKDKKIFIIATMGLFSGDGTGCSARLLTKYGAHITGGLHLQMPDCICDVKALKRPIENNINMVCHAMKKAKTSAEQLKSGSATHEGLGVFYHMAGLFGQRLYFYNKTAAYTDRLKINSDLCIGCGLCATHCPMQNITITQGKANAKGKCTMCYRCISHCPAQAITLLGNKVIEQCRIENYISKEI